jgi:hypothetical protein
MKQKNHKARLMYLPSWKDKLSSFFTIYRINNDNMSTSSLIISSLFHIFKIIFLYHNLEILTIH